MKTKITILFAIVCSLAATSQTWTTYTATNGLVNNCVNAIAIDAKGNKWFGTNGGVSKFDGTNWSTYTSNHLSWGVNAIAIDAQGNIWFGGEGFGILKFDGTNWTTYTTTNGLADNFVWSITIDTKGNKWFGTSSGVSKFDGTSWTSYMNNTFVDVGNFLYAISIDAIAVNAQGNMWFGTSFMGSIGVWKFDGTNWTTYTNNGLANGVNAIAIDSLGNVWCGGSESGVWKFDGTNWTTYTNYGLADGVNAIAIDSLGNIWFGTIDNGVTKFDGTNWTTNNTGLVNGFVNAIAIDAQGNKWFGTEGGVSEFENVTLNISKNTLILTDTANSTATFDITSNTSWNINNDQTWLKISSISGSNNDTITVTASANSSDSVRTAIVTISGNGVASKTLMVMQATASPAVLSVSTDSLNVTATKNSNASFEITSNIIWNVSSDQSWLKVYSPLGANNDTITVTASANPDTSSRTATLTVSGNGVTSDTVKVIQAAGPAALSVSKNTLNINATANSTATFGITSNISWTVKSNQTWLTLSSASGYDNAIITVTASANPSESQRTATVTISGDGATSKTVTVTQAGPAALSVSKNALNVNDTANSTATFGITSNISWNIESNQTWLYLSWTVGNWTYINGPGSDSATITVTALANPSDSQRTATVTVSGNGVASKTITITQAASGTGITEIPGPDIQLYPVPVIDKMFISFSKPLSQTSINIYTLNGIKVYSSYITNSITEVDMSKYASGIYFVKIITPDGVTNKKIIKQ